MDTRDAKRRIRDSRVMGTRNLVRHRSRVKRPAEVLISASAVGYYGSRGDDVLAECEPPARNWLAEVCVEWEREAAAAEAGGSG